MSRSGLFFVSLGVFLVLLNPEVRAAADPASPASPDTLTGLARRAMDHSGVTWREFDGKAVRVHCQPGTFGARHVAALTRSADGALEEAVALVDSGAYGPLLNVFLLTSRDQMIGLLEFRATGFADWRSSSVFLVVRDDRRSFDLHETTHAVSMSKWGEPAEPVWWIRGGLAVYAGGRCRDHTVAELAAEYLRPGTLPTAAGKPIPPEEWTRVDSLGCG